MIDEEMPAAGVEPDERTLGIMAGADKLLSRKHTREMMKCKTSDDRREYMAQMKADGCLPNVYQFNVLIKQLLYEGKKEEAQRVIDEEMPAAGVEPNERIFETMARADELLSSKHTTEMMKCKTSNEKREYMSQMKADGCLPGVYQFNVLLKQLLYEGKKGEAQRGGTFCGGRVANGW